MSSTFPNPFTEGLTKEQRIAQYQTALAEVARAISDKQGRGSLQLGGDINVTFSSLEQLRSWQDDLTHRIRMLQNPGSQVIR